MEGLVADLAGNLAVGSAADLAGDLAGVRLAGDLAVAFAFEGAEAGEGAGLVGVTAEAFWGVASFLGVSLAFFSTGPVAAER